MNIDKSSIEKLNGLSDSDLKRLIGEISVSLGADQRKVASLTADMSKLRGNLNNITQEEIDRLIAHVGREKAEEIIKSVKRGRP